ncbi:MAG: hypothetical protein LBH59_00755 [Planctomycetaceae bacterium]|nr:hypothetical protein [Planctomycetaceae bacterium]
MSFLLILKLVILFAVLVYKWNSIYFEVGMARVYIRSSIAVFLLSFFLVLSGCFTAGPTVGPFSVPVVVLPFVQSDAERAAYENTRFNGVDILDPIVGTDHIALDPPTDDQCVRHFEKIRPITGQVPGLETCRRDIVGITKELIADYIEEPRFFPLIGPAQVHHAHYKITIYFKETINVGWPVPHTINDDEAVEVFYVDKDHLHRVGEPVANLSTDMHQH